MKHIFYILIFCIGVSCCTSKKEESEQKAVEEKIAYILKVDSIKKVHDSILANIHYDTNTTIGFICDMFDRDLLSPEEIAHWDSLDDYLLIREAERNLDTTVNHIHIKFITEE